MRTFETEIFRSEDGEPPTKRKAIARAYKVTKVKDWHSRTVVGFDGPIDGLKARFADVIRDGEVKMDVWLSFVGYKAREAWCEVDDGDVRVGDEIVQYEVNP